MRNGGRRRLDMMHAVFNDSRRAILIIVLCVVVANAAFTLFGFDANPLWWTSGVASRYCPWGCGLPSIDPNVGFITQPLGHAAAMSLLHGHLPWWNYFEGLGQPLAGEMQSAALFPLVLWFALPGGVLWFHMSLEVIAGVSTYFLMRRLTVGSTIAMLAGVAFALNGTFAWIANAVVNPIAFLPMTLLGVEIALGAATSRRRGGWALLACAVALSIYAGFPEMTYLDGLLVIVWAAVRGWSAGPGVRLRAYVRIGLGGLGGLALAAPIIVAFEDFYRVANIGAHAAQGLSSASTPPSSFPLLIDPYLRGALFGGSTSTPVNLLGYAGATLAVLALVGVVGARLRSLRLTLLGWCIAVGLGALNAPVVRSLWNLLPTMRQIAFARYVWPSVEMAVVVLAALGLSDLVESAARRTWGKWACALVAAVSLAGVLHFVPLGGPLQGSVLDAVGVLIVLPFIAVAAIGFALQFLEGRALLRVVGTVLILEAVAFFATPGFRSPTYDPADTGTISYLEQHEGLNRFVSLSVLNPNWGSQYAINEINAIDLPSPVAFTNYIKVHLAPDIKNPRIFTLPFTPAVEQEFAAHLPAYEALGVAYVLTPPAALDSSLAAAGLVEVAKDSHTILYRVPHPSGYYSTGLPGCTLVHETVDSVDVDCPAATTLERRELMMPGWSAQVNGHAVSITSPDGLTQSVAIPAGTSRVTFDFLPPHEEWAGIAAALTLAAMVASVSVRPRRRRSAGSVDPSGADEATDDTSLSAS